MKKTSRAYKIKKKLRQKEIKNRTKRVSSKIQVLHYSFFDVQQKTLKRVQCNNLVFLSIYTHRKNILNRDEKLFITFPCRIGILYLIKKKYYVQKEFILSKSKSV